MDSILASVKKMLGLDADYTPFDIDIINFINSTLMTLHQMGVGTSRAFVISGDTETWSQFLEGRTDLEWVKTYVYLKVRLLFDPPSNGSVMEAMNKQCEELEWRMNSRIDYESGDVSG